MYSADTAGMVFNMQGYSVHDGPGIRTLVFLKGCPLHCSWCSNPESQSGKRELGYKADICLHCGRCVAVCPEKVLTLTAQGMAIQREGCIACGRCAEVCPGKALTVYGYSMTARAVLDKVEQDAAFYARSGGGMTVSGGEPFMQHGFLMALLKEAEKRAIHTAVETCGFVPEAAFLEGAALLDYVLFDIKQMDATVHKRVTGQDNAPILRNFRSLRATYPSLPVHIRTPVIPGVNDTEEAIEAIARFARDNGAVQYELLPFHRMGEQKYGFLGRESSYPGRTLEQQTLERLQAVVQRFFPA